MLFGNGKIERKCQKKEIPRIKILGILAHWLLLHWVNRIKQNACLSLQQLSTRKNFEAKGTNKFQYNINCFGFKQIN